LQENGYDDAVLNDFLRKHRAVDVKHHFFVKSETQYLTLLITFHVTPQDLDRVEHAETKVRDSQESWKTLLQESDMGLFQLLRAWRGRRARTDGLPLWSCDKIAKSFGKISAVHWQDGLRDVFGI
jgi:hypothetical protein